METQSVSSSEDDKTKEFDTDSSDSMDENYIPPICVRTGGALKSKISLDALPVVSMEA